MATLLYMVKKLFDACNYPRYLCTGIYDVQRRGSYWFVDLSSFWNLWSKKQNEHPERR